jgi:hypothetical protein
MRSFRIALGVLTFLRFSGPAPTRDEWSRSLAHFPLIGILVGTVLVLVDQGIAKWIPVLVSNALLLLILEASRFSRGVENLRIPFNLPQRTSCLLLKYFLFVWLPIPLRWISLTFMTTFSAGALALAFRKSDPEMFEWENVLWSSLVCVFLGIICGTLGIFVTSMSALVLVLAFRFLKNRLEWIEEGMEVVVLGLILVFHYYWKIFWHY